METITNTAIASIKEDLEPSSFVGQSVARIFVAKNGNWGAEVIMPSQVSSWSSDWAYWISVPLGTGSDDLSECGEGVEYTQHMKTALIKAIEDLEGMEILTVDSHDLQTSYHTILQDLY